MAPKRYEGCHKTAVQNTKSLPLLKFEQLCGELTHFSVDRKEVRLIACFIRCPFLRRKTDNSD